MKNMQRVIGITLCAAMCLGSVNGAVTNTASRNMRALRAAELSDQQLAQAPQKDSEFLAYQNQMLRSIKDHWSWRGSTADLITTVQFGIKEDGSITEITLVTPSVNSSFDESIISAIRSSSPFSPPPEKVPGRL
jgi:hypothetical protein